MFYHRVSLKNREDDGYPTDGSKHLSNADVHSGANSSPGYWLKGMLRLSALTSEWLWTDLRWASKSNKQRTRASLCLLPGPLSLRPEEAKSWLSFWPPVTGSLRKVEKNTKEEMMASAHIMPILRIITEYQISNHSQETIQYVHFMYFASETASKALL